MRQAVLMAIFGFVMLAFGTAGAQAQANRAFVAAQGSDAGACPVATPCKTFAYAIQQVAAGGEIDVLNSGNYGPVVIDKALSIVSPGTLANIGVNAGASGVTVNAGYAAVTLRGLTLDGHGVGQNGIVLTGPGTINIVDCTVSNMTQTGIALTPTSQGTAVISGTTVFNNGSDGIFAVATGSGELVLSITGSKLIGNGIRSSGNGLHVKGLGASFFYGSADTTLISENGTGFYMEANSPNVVQLVLSDSRVVGNQTIGYLGASTNVVLEKTTLVAAGGGITNNGSLQSFGDNAFIGSVTGTPLQPIGLR